MRAIHCPLSQSDRLSDYLARGIRAGIGTISRNIFSLAYLRQSPRIRLPSAISPSQLDCCQGFGNTELTCRDFTNHLVIVHHSLLRQEVAVITSLLKQLVTHLSSPSGTLTELRVLFQVLSSSFLAQLHRDETTHFPLLAQLESSAGFHEYAQEAICEIQNKQSFVQEGVARMRWLIGEEAAPRILARDQAKLFAGLTAFEFHLQWHFASQFNYLLPRSKHV